MAKSRKERLEKKISAQTLSTPAVSVSFGVLNNTVLIQVDKQNSQDLISIPVSEWNEMNKRLFPKKLKAVA